MRNIIARRVRPVGTRRKEVYNNQAEADISLHAHPGKQAALLEHHRVLDRPARGLDLDGAAGLFRQPREDPQQRRLPAARRTDDTDELARRDVQIDVVERHHAALAAHELLAQSDECRPPPPRAAQRPFEFSPQACSL